MVASMNQPRPKPKHPCSQDCGERTAECHKTCEKWAKYEAEKKADYALRDDERMLKDAHICAHKNRAKKGCFIGWN